MTPSPILLHSTFHTPQTTLTLYPTHNHRYYFYILLILHSTYPRAPIKQNSLCILRARVDQVKGRKLYMSATLSDITGANGTGGVTGANGVTGAGVTGGVTGVVGRVCVESSTLFVTMKPWDQFLLRLGGWVGI
jgi:hypothetical protein